MAKTAQLEVIPPEELTEEGRKMWENIANFEKLSQGMSILAPERLKKLKLNMFEIELMFIRTEVRKMIKNSQRVIEECEEIIKKCKTKEEYFKCEARVAKTIHTNLIERLQRILDLNEAFDHKIFVDEEEKRYVVKKPSGK